jgi:tRNA pseudouridine55 synthase
VQGLLLIDKPADWTSFDVVNYVRRMVATIEDKKPKNIKVGHSGTLDPFATGLLVLFIGKAYTTRAQEYTKLDKTYELTMKLGKTSTTGDSEGEIVKQSDKVPDLDEIKDITSCFKGEIDQKPPIFSAIKVNGQRAYKLAREGKLPELESRKVNIKRLEILNYTYPELDLIVDVSSGTYIRSLVGDIGELLGTGAYTSVLRRTKVGDFDLHTAVTPKSLTPELLQELTFEAAP